MEAARRVRRIMVILLICIAPSAVTLIANPLCLMAATYFSRPGYLELSIGLLYLPFLLGGTTAFYMGEWAFPEKFIASPKKFMARVAYIAVQAVLVFYAWGHILPSDFTWR
jgi:hypothetical protein